MRKIFCYNVHEDMSITKYTFIRFSLLISLAIAAGLVIVIGDIASSSAQQKNMLHLQPCLTTKVIRQDC
jgi:hypothetical protein